jgi:uncharacterized protein YqeY
MSLETKVMESLKEAMRAKDTHALNALRSIKSALLLAKTDGSGDEMTEAREMQIVQKLVKQRKDSLSIFQQQNRADLAEVEAAELVTLEKFLPAMMSDQEVESAIQAIIAQTGATSPKDMGKVMGVAMKSLAGKADGGLISSVVKQLLGA